MRETMPYGLIAGEMMDVGVMVDNGVSIGDGVGVGCNVGVVIEESVGVGVALDWTDGIVLHPLGITPSIAQNKKTYIENRPFRVIILHLASQGKQCFTLVANSPSSPSTL